MCGILGTNFNIDKDTFNNSLISLVKRGPDNISLKKINEFYLGHTRLSIIDLSEAANQPMTIGNYTIVFNGELYNYKELAKKYKFNCLTTSDTEVILRMFINFKEKSLKEFDGMFAFAIYDNKDKSLFLARDYCGEKPLYYMIKNGKIIFSSTIKGIKKIFSNLSLNKQAIWDYFTFLWIPEPDTIYEEIKSLSHGHYLYFREGEVRIKKFNYNFKFFKNSIIETTKDLVTEAVKLRTISDVKIGTFLSGGLDSSIVTKLTTKYVDNLDVFTIGFKDNKEPYTGFADETEYAEIMAKNLRINHHIIYLDQKRIIELLFKFIEELDQPYAVSSALGILSIAEKAHSLGIKVLLSGDGADEAFGGYTWYPKLKFNDIKYFSKEKPKGWHYYLKESEKKLLLNQDFFNNSIKSSIRYLIEDYKHTDPIEYIKHDREFYLVNEMMTKLDLMTMANSVEGRAIFVSPKIMKFVEKISYEDLLKNGIKWILKESFSDTIPEKILKRKKHGFNFPLAYCFYSYWNDYLDNIFSRDSILKKIGIISDNTKENFIKNFLKDKRFGDISFQFFILNKWLEKEYDFSSC